MPYQSTQLENKHDGCHFWYKLSAFLQFMEGRCYFHSSKIVSGHKIVNPVKYACWIVVWSPEWRFENKKDRDVRISFWRLIPRLDSTFLVEKRFSRWRGNIDRVGVLPLSMLQLVLGCCIIQPAPYMWWPNPMMNAYNVRASKNYFPHSFSPWSIHLSLNHTWGSVVLWSTDFKMEV